MANRPGGRMDIGQRAKQFMPFAALKGLPEALAEREQIVVTKVELTEDAAAELDWKLHRLEQGDAIIVTYFYQRQYQKIAGIVVGIDETNRVLQVANTRIGFEDILNIEFNTV